MRSISTSKQLSALRKILSKKNVHAYILPSEDEHFSEYVDPADRRYTFISGFTGSTCSAVITLDHAALWVDGRYHAQASHELGPDWTLMKQGLPDVPDEATWLAANTPEGCFIGFDPKQLSYLRFKSFKDALTEIELTSNHASRTRTLMPIAGPNLVDVVWDEFSSHANESYPRPSRSANPLLAVPVSFAGQSWKTKIEQIRRKMVEKGAAIFVISALDEIAWLFNFRGSDIHYNPVCFAYAVLTLHDAHLYLHQSTQIQSENILKDYTEDQDISVTIHPYGDFLTHFNSLLNTLTNPRDRVWCSVDANYAIVSSIPESRRLLTGSYVADLKAIKTPEELAGIRSAHVTDSLVLCDFLAWLEEVAEQNRRADANSTGSALHGNVCSPAGLLGLPAPELLTESSVASYLDNLRSQSPDFFSLSFSTIAACDANGAVIHYHPESGKDLPVTGSSLFLIDSGGQYLTGTTDVTRTVHLGSPSPQQKFYYTMVLKAHIALSRQCFPRNTLGSRLDVLCRRELWNHQCDYSHGTGHGVGAFLCVHEGPFGLSGKRLTAANKSGIPEPGLVENMVATIEPGYYRDNEFGIRLENVTFVVPAPKLNHSNIPLNDTVQWLTFSPVTLVPFQQKLIDKSMLTTQEIDWLNQYHANVRESLQLQLHKEHGGSEFDPDALSSSRRRCLEWILRETNPLT